MTQSEVARGVEYSICPASQMLTDAIRAAEFLRAIAHPMRLVILCKLSEGPQRVGDLAEFLQMPQASLSHQLARLRGEDLVEADRNGRAVTYSLKGEATRDTVSLMYRAFCFERTPGPLHS